jgi:DNA-binding transcriptional regulator YiaG
MIMTLKQREYARELRRRRLYRVMRDYHLSCRDVAEKVGVKEQTVRTWRTGRYGVPQSVILLLTQLYPPR